MSLLLFWNGANNPLTLEATAVVAEVVVPTPTFALPITPVVVSIEPGTIIAFAGTTGTRVILLY